MIMMTVRVSSVLVCVVVSFNICFARQSCGAVKLIGFVFWWFVFVYFFTIVLFGIR